MNERLQVQSDAEQLPGVFRGRARSGSLASRSTPRQGAGITGFALILAERFARERCGRRPKQEVSW